MTDFSDRSDFAALGDRSCFQPQQAENLLANTAKLGMTTADRLAPSSDHDPSRMSASAKKSELHRVVVGAGQHWPVEGHLSAERQKSVVLHAWDGCGGCTGCGDQDLQSVCERPISRPYATCSPDMANGAYSAIIANSVTSDDECLQAAPATFKELACVALNVHYRPIGAQPLPA